jgi:hypothetical protein
MISLRTQYRNWSAVLILFASLPGCSAWNNGTPSEMQASVGTNKTTTPTGVDRKGGLVFQDASYQDDHVTQPH